MKKSAITIMQAHGLLLSRASALVRIGKVSSFTTSCYAYIGMMNFNFSLEGGDEIVLEFGEKHPFNQEEVDSALAKMDAILAEAREEARSTYEFLKAWEA